MFGSWVHPSGMMMRFVFEDSVCDDSSVFGAELQQKFSIGVTFTDTLYPYNIGPVFCLCPYTSVKITSNYQLICDWDILDSVSQVTVELLFFLIWVSHSRSIHTHNGHVAFFFSGSRMVIILSEIGVGS